MLLSCVMGSGGAYSCQPINVVTAGAQCGLVGTTEYVCAGNLYCDTSAATPTCTAMLGLDAGCLATVANECTFELYCATNSTRQTPPPPICM